VLKKHPKTTNFRQFPLTFCQKVLKKPQKAHKIVNIDKSLCHHLNPLSQKHLTPLFSESPISPHVHSRPPKSPFFAQKRRFTPENRDFHPPPHPKILKFAQKSLSLSHTQRDSTDPETPHPHQNPPQVPARRHSYSIFITSAKTCHLPQIWRTITAHFLLVSAGKSRKQL
jgi:hypothetical protein